VTLGWTDDMKGGRKHQGQERLNTMYVLTLSIKIPRHFSSSPHPACAMWVRGIIGAIRRGPGKRYWALPLSLGHYPTSVAVGSLDFVV
jgi:hypothetical protein